MKNPSRIMLSRITVVFMASILLCAAMPAINIKAFSAQAASTTVTLQASDLIELGTEDAVCYEHGYHLPCQHCACFMAMAEAQGGVQYVRAASDGYYMLGFLQEGYFVGSYLAKDADGQSGTGEGMAVEQIVGNAQLAAHAAHFVLEQETQRLYQPQLHGVG